VNDRIGSVVIQNVTPSLDCGRYPVKRVVGETVRVEADVFKEGHDVLVAVVRYRQIAPQGEASDWAEAPMQPLGNDRFFAEFALPRVGRWAYTVEAWPDGYRTWSGELERKVAAGRDVKSELLEGAALLEAASARAGKVAADQRRLREAAQALRESPSQKVAIAAALDTGLIALASRYPDRTVATRFEPPREVYADRARAISGAWYEFFPRSAAGIARHGTFKDAEALLPRIERLGFDVIYLPPIHPIGSTARKGKNNSLTAGPEDVGSPWAIGNKEGGHKAVHPKLGTLEDFRRFVGRAAEYGIEVALDLAYQCSPDHPYVKEHPEWFLHRPDGTIKTAENPPKRYEDIVNFDWLGPKRESLWRELKSVVDHWVANGVRIFRVDNPHTKPLVFWEWLIRSVQDEHPDVVFLAEAFTRPRLMQGLAKLGFTQSYTYFTWRNFKQELTDYLTELTQGPEAEYMRGNLWPNTPDILPELLQRGGPPAFRSRFVLAATLSSVYGLYMNYEWCENRAHHGEEYLDSEKYQLAKWEFDRPGAITELIEKVNRIRKENPALLQYRNLRFYPSDNDRVIFYGKRTLEGDNQVLIAVSLDPYEAQEATLTVPVEELGVSATESYEVEDLLGSARHLWQGRAAKVRLTPDAPAAIWRVKRFARNEASFDYFY
jgi:starch synthase (maltosyl-transferring)